MTSKLIVRPNASLAGCQMKYAVTSHNFNGTIVDVRGDHPTAPQQIGFLVQPDGDRREIVVVPATMQDGHVTLDKGWDMVPLLDGRNVG